MQPGMQPGMQLGMPPGMQPGMQPRPPARPAPTEAENAARREANKPAWMKHGVGVGKRKYGHADAAEAEATGFFKPGQQGDGGPGPAKEARIETGTCSKVPLAGLKTPDGDELEAFMLRGKNIHVEVISWGVYITKIITPDAEGKWADVALGFDFPSDFPGYHKTGPEGRSRYYGCVVGRFCNRIKHGKFDLNGQTYTLAVNNGENHLHGGEKGWHQYNWQVRGFGTDSTSGDPFVTFARLSKDGEEGYPCAVNAEVRVSITGGDTLRLEYKVVNLDGSRSTPVNVTNHTYFNLSGDFERSVYNHALQLNSDSFCAVDKNSIPVEIRSVKGTPFDFTEKKRIGDRIDNKKDEQITNVAGYDHSFVLKGEEGEMKHVGTAIEPESRRKMEVFTTEPAVQLYSGNFIPRCKGETCKGGVGMGYRGAFCLETQHLPDSPNQPDFPSTILKPGGEYVSTTTHKFSIADEKEILQPIHYQLRMDHPNH